MEKIKLASIKLNPKNPRIIRDNSFKSLIESIKRDPEYLEKRGIVVADGVILGGNQRYFAIKVALKDDSFRESLGLEKGEMPAAWVVDASEWSEEKRRRFVVVDNGVWGEWDFDLLANEWSDLPLIDFGVNLPEDWLRSEEPEESDLKLDEVGFLEGKKKTGKFTYNESDESAISDDLRVMGEKYAGFRFYF
ncbi:MAG: hypothetical protein PHH96_07405 [Smithellaceae bacterium]|nr:hypothetical protein [Smithellaceae bacterium]